MPQSASNLRAQAFEGLVGSVESARASNNGNQFQFETTRALQSGEGLTIVAGWPLGIVEPPSAWTKAMWFLLDNGILALPLIVLVWVILYFRRHGKDPFGRGTIAPEFGPPKALSLLEQAALRDERLQARDLSALIVSWAVDGFITIEEPKKNEITLVRRKEISGRPDYELQFFSKVFSGASDNRAQLTKLAGKLQTPAHNLRMAVFRDLVKKGYFVANPQTVRAVWLVGGFGLLMVSWILGALLGLPWLIAFAVSGLIVLVAAPLMPQRTHEGVLAKEQVEGFELYLKTAERYRMEFYEKEKVFERYLPYAMAFGVATIWAKAFGDIAKSAPSWYTGYYGTHWVPLQFAQGLENSLQSNMNTAMTTASSGGSGFSGGFSGGGFGGGGGGSW